MYIAVPFIPDTATASARQFLQDYAARHGEPPSWGAIYAYDSALILVEALSRAQIATEAAEISALRAAVRHELAAMNSTARGVVGFLGLTSFNADGDVLRPIHISRTQGRHVEAAARQLQFIQNPDLINSLRSQGENIIDLGDALLQVTQVVQTGLQLNRIDEIDETAKTFRADFELWFRFSGSLETDGVVFPDAATPVSLETPLKTRELGAESYRSYQVSATFRYASTHENLVNGNEDFAIRFFDATRDRSRLVFVADSQGMGLADGRQSWADSLRRQGVVPPDSGWVGVDAAIFMETVGRSTLGDPLFPVLTLPYSTFNANIHTHEAEVSLRRQIAALLPATGS